jgi:hypothetical protein
MQHQKTVLKLVVAGSCPAMLALSSSHAQMLAGDPVAKPAPQAATQPAPSPIVLPPIDDQRTIKIAGMRE